MSPDSPSACARRNARAVFVAAAAVAFVGTHWPRLDLSAAGSPIDKFGHALCFGVLSLLLWRTGWLGRPWKMATVMVAWSVLDELSQAIPGLGRFADLEDWLADLIGITLATALIWALGPVGVAGGFARLLGARRACALDSLLAAPTAWLHIGTAAALGAAAGAPLGVLIDSWFIRKGPLPWQYGFIGGVLGAGVAAHALLETGIRGRLRRLSAERPCLRCGCVPARGAASDAPCEACGAPRRASDWAPVAGVGGDVELRRCAMPVVLGLAAIIVLNFSAIALLTALRTRSALVLRFDTWVNLLPPDGRVLLDVTGVALVGAWTLRRCRTAVASAQDAAGATCLRCGYDLRATSDERGTGTCPDCGEAFVRLPPAAQP
jgi:VanZ family protein